jgi:hypothetical protein
MQKLATDLTPVFVISGRQILKLNIGKELAL